MKCLNEEEFEKLKDERDPYDAPSNPYCTPNPGKPGKLLWISGLETDAKKIRLVQKLAVSKKSTILIQSS